jgi:hypothetical protein
MVLTFLTIHRDPNHAFSGTLGSKSKPDLVDIAHALRIRQVTHPGKEKLTKKKIQDFIDAHSIQIPRNVKIHGLKDCSMLAEGLGLTKT